MELMNQPFSGQLGDRLIELLDLARLIHRRHGMGLADVA